MAVGRMIQVIVVGVLVCMGSASVGSAHTVAGRIVDAKSVTAEFRYADGTAMAFSEVSVFSPVENVLYQTGRADGSGRFAFVPDRAGAWRVEVRDEENHLATVSVEVDARIAVRRSMQSYRDAALAISVALNLACLFSLWQARRDGNSDLA